MFDWEAFAEDKTWTFVTRDKIEGKKFTHINSCGKTTDKYFQYKTLKINPFGEMTFDTFTDECYHLEDEEKNKIIEVFDRKNEDCWKGGNTIDGLVYSSIDNIHTIISTTKRTLPNTSTLWRALKETDVNILRDRDELLEEIETYPKEMLNTKDAKNFAKVIDGFKASEKGITNKKARDILNMHTSVGKILNRYLSENFGIWIAPEFKNEDFADEYMLENLFDVQYYMEKENDRLSAYYYASINKSGLQSSLNNSCVIRRVISETGKLEFEELIPLLTVDFVRADGGSTVVPFSFKYLREWGN